MIVVVVVAFVVVVEAAADFVVAAVVVAAAVDFEKNTAKERRFLSEYSKEILLASASERTE